MKLSTTPEQTARLIELGFEKPKSIGGYEPTFVVEYEGVEVSNVIIGENKQCPIFAYSIAELLSFLPQFMDFDDGKWPLSIGADPFKVNGTWWVFYEPSYHTESVELINAIFDMLIKLKEEGVI